VLVEIYQRGLYEVWGQGPQAGRWALGRPRGAQSVSWSPGLDV